MHDGLKDGLCIAFVESTDTGEDTKAVQGGVCRGWSSSRAIVCMRMTCGRHTVSSAAMVQAIGTIALGNYWEKKVEAKEGLAESLPPYDNMELQNRIHFAAAAQGI